jgi:3-oxoacyl-[acyl-carrier-protein] synthase II
MSLTTEPRRVVITGIGVISACGLTVTDFWDSIVKGKSGAKPITRFDTSELPTKIAAEITNFDCANYLSPKKYKRYDLGMQFAAAASLEAVADSKLKIGKMDADRVGLIHANSLEGMESAFEVYPTFSEFGYKKLGPSFLLNNYFGSASGELAMIHGIKGHAITYSAGSASGSDVITLAASMISNDEVDAIVVGASEAPLLVQVMAGFCNAHIVTRKNHEVSTAMKPFDEDHDGFLLGEGAAFFVLEEISHAVVRGARIYAEFIGGGRACEAYHPVNIHPQGLGIKSCISKALKKSRITISSIQYINAHGTATNLNDKIEAEAIKDFFGSHCSKLAVSATKPNTGHLLAASGAIETAVCALAVYNQVVPPIINLKKPVDGGILDFVRDKARAYPLENVINISAGFGGKNSCVILKRFS